MCFRCVHGLSNWSATKQSIKNALSDRTRDPKHNILAEEQFGFRSYSATNKAVYKLINETLNALNSKFIVGGIFFNLEKTFDCLNHSILLSKLQFCGVNGKAKSWFE